MANQKRPRKPAIKIGKMSMPEKYRDKNGNPMTNRPGMYLWILNTDPKIKKAQLYHDQFSRADRIDGPAPWSRVNKQDHVFDPKRDFEQLQMYLSETYNININPTWLKVALNSYFTKHKRNRLQEWLTREKWDGVERAERLLIDYLGAEDSVLARLFMRVILCSMMLKAFNLDPEDPVITDGVLALVGPPHKGKSSFFRKLCGPFFSDDPMDIESDNSRRQFSEYFGIEAPELAGIVEKDPEKLKAFITRVFNTWRALYSEYTKKVPMIGTLFLTSNYTEFIPDPKNGLGRRVWAVAVGVQDVSKEKWEELSKVIPQIWSEVYHWMKMGENLLHEDGRPYFQTNLTPEQMEMATENALKFALPNDDLDRLNLWLAHQWVDPIIFDLPLGEKGRALADSGTPGFMPRPFFTAKDVYSFCFNGIINGQKRPFNQAVAQYIGKLLTQTDIIYTRGMVKTSSLDWAYPRAYFYYHPDYADLDDVLRKHGRSAHEKIMARLKQDALDLEAKLHPVTVYRQDSLYGDKGMDYEIPEIPLPTDDDAPMMDEYNAYMESKSEGFADFDDSDLPF